MVVPLPHKTLTEYHRDFELGILEKYCPETCPLCQAPIDLFEYRLRKILNIFLLRGRCQGPDIHYFTFLPLFAASGKWYGYETIEESLIFVNQGGFANVTTALAAWEKKRETRIDDKETPGPSSRTVHRWQKELGQNHPKCPWAARAQQGLLQLFESGGQRMAEGAPDEEAAPLAVAVIARPASPEPSPIPGFEFTAGLLTTLRLLGEVLLGTTVSHHSRSFLGLGIWFLESRYQQRCLARFDLTGNVVPGPVPDMSVTRFFWRGYPPFS